MNNNKFTYFGGYWSTNIGNAFYDKGILYVLRQLFGEKNVSFIHESSIYGTLPYMKYIMKFPILEKFDKSFKRELPYLSNLSSDVVVRSGPLFDRHFKRICRNTLVTYRDQGKKIIFISAGGNKYDAEERDSVGAVLEEIKPYALITRDHETYENYKKFFQYSYDGICFSLFANDYHVVTPMSLGKFMVWNFDRGFDYDIRQIVQRDMCGNQLRAAPVLKRSMRAGKLNDYAGYRIVRPDHEFSRFGLKYSRKTNWVRADTPGLYLSLYAQTSATFSERVHACLPTLAFGNPAMLIVNTPRSRIFDRLGLSNIREKLVTLDPQILKNEKERMVAFIKSIF